MELVAKYFNLEKIERIIFMLVRVAAILLTSYFFIKIKQPFCNGISYSLIAIALMQIGTKSFVYFRSPKDIIRVNAIIQKNNSQIKTEEIPRMELVMKNFVLYRWIEIALFIIILVLFFAVVENSFWRGSGVGLTIQAGFMLLLDFFAEY